MYAPVNVQGTGAYNFFILFICQVMLSQTTSWEQFPLFRLSLMT
jgi:hypothetical protein